MTTELLFLLRAVTLLVSIFAACVNFSRTQRRRHVCGFDWFFQSLVTTVFVALTWF
jgi:hypothetical protein